MTTRTLRTGWSLAGAGVGGAGAAGGAGAGAVGCCPRATPPAGTASAIVMTSAGTCVFTVRLLLSSQRTPKRPRFRAVQSQWVRRRYPARAPVTRPGCLHPETRTACDLAERSPPAAEGRALRSWRRGPRSPSADVAGEPLPVLTLLE